MDISIYPYFSYREQIKSIFTPLSSQINVKIIDFERIYPNGERFYIVNDVELVICYFKKEFYKYGLFEKPINMLQSSFNMWDFLPEDPRGIYQYVRDHFDNAHGLTIIKQHYTHCDFFLLATSKNNFLINNFYLNNKEVILHCIEDFYLKMHKPLEELKKHCFWVPANMASPKPYPESIALSKRQSECAFLLLEGLTTKQIAQEISLSPRTVEEYITHLKGKLGVANKTLLTIKLHDLSRKGLIPSI